MSVRENDLFDDDYASGSADIYYEDWNSEYTKDIGNSAAGGVFTVKVTND